MLPLRYGIGSRLTVGILALLLSVLGGFQLIVLSGKRASHERELEVQARRLARTAASACLDPLLVRDYAVLDEFMHDLTQRDPDVLRAVVKRADGEIVADSSPGNRAVTDEGARTFVYAQDVTIDGETLGQVEFTISSRRIDTRNRTDERELRVLFLVLGASLALFIASFIKRTLRIPLARLERSARRLAEGDLETPINISRDDELGTLARALDEMRRAHRGSLAEIQRKNQELEALNTAKTTFLANTSHEIRTPISAILGYAEILSEDKLDAAEVREHAETIHRSTKKLLALLDDVLDLSKIEAGELRVTMRECDISTVVEDCFELFRARMLGLGLGFTLHGLEELPSRARTDPDRVHQVLCNLLGNAMKFTERGGVSIRVLSASDDDRVSICVEDTGPGISKMHQEHLFDRFYQIDGSRQRRKGGVGLGLSISSELAQLLGGRLTAASEVGVGSRFTLQFPVRADPVDAVAAALPSPSNTPTRETVKRVRGDRILVVEDVPVNRRMLQSFLTKAGFRVATADDGAQAVDCVLAADAEGDPFQLVFMDVQMPVLDGYEATARIREAGFDLSIVALTAHAMRCDQERCLQAGCDEYATKPIGRAELVAIAKRYVGEPAASA